MRVYDLAPLILGVESGTGDRSMSRSGGKHRAIGWDETNVNGRLAGHRRMAARMYYYVDVLYVHIHIVHTCVICNT